MAVRKKAIKRPVKRKATKKKKPAKQTGSSVKKIDVTKQAKPVGKRKSAKGKTYYETRANRSDKGKLLGIGAYISGQEKKYIALYDSGTDWEQAEFKAYSLKDAKRYAQSYKRHAKLKGKVTVRLKKSHEHYH